MSQLRLYLNEDSMRRSLVFALRARNVDLLTAFDAPMVNRPDAEHLSFANSGRVLYSYNVADYCVLHRECIAKGRSHAGIVLAQQQRYSSGDELRRLMHLIANVSAEAMRDRLEFLSGWGLELFRTIRNSAVEGETSWICWRKS